jgi:para-nitrobenzyl esterase
MVSEHIFLLHRENWVICILLLTLLLLSACGGGGSTSPPPPPSACTSVISPVPGLVVTDSGPIQGMPAGQTFAFLGVPYAAPPLGALRWQPPQDPACRDSTLDTTAFMAGCIQKKFDQFSDTSTIEGSEDCLYLNVWTPENYTAAHMPVMVFIHGGGNQQGAASQLTAGVMLYDGARLAERSGAVVVTVDYRLGPLGYPAHPALTDISGHYGNWGLLDQIKALQWVQHHIARFGGDPTRVLLFGESGGAVDTCMLLVSPQANGLFARVAIESGACTAMTLADREQTSGTYITDLGCETAPDVKSCLIALDEATLIMPETRPINGGIVSQTFGPAVDGWLLPQKPMLALQQGSFNHVPLLLGSNGQEMSVTVPPDSVNRAMVLALFAGIPEPARTDLLTLYDPGSAVSLLTPSSEARDSFIRATTDAQFTCQARRVAQLVYQSPGQTDPVYRYHFTHRLSGTLGDTYGAYHGFELFYVFQTIGDSSHASLLTSDDLDTEQQTLGYWTRFAASGDPNDSTAATGRPMTAPIPILHSMPLPSPEQAC